MTFTLRVRCYLRSASLNRNGMETHTATGPLFMYAGVKTHCFAASTAGSLKISASLFRITTCFGLSLLVDPDLHPHLPFEACAHGEFGVFRFDLLDGHRFFFHRHEVRRRRILVDPDILLDLDGAVTACSFDDRCYCLAHFRLRGHRLFGADFRIGHRHGRTDRRFRRRGRDRNRRRRVGAL